MLLVWSSLCMMCITTSHRNPDPFYAWSTFSDLKQGPAVLCSTLILGLT